MKELLKALIEQSMLLNNMKADFIKREVERYSAALADAETATSDADNYEAYLELKKKETQKES